VKVSAQGKGAEAQGHCHLWTMFVSTHLAQEDTTHESCEINGIQKVVKVPEASCENPCLRQ
jgi:hypothetical protein